MQFLRENWWKMIVCVGEMVVILRFFRWHFDAKPNNLRVQGVPQGEENDWDKPAA